MINSHWKILQCCLFWVGLIRRMWPYSDTNHFTFPLYGNGGPSRAIKVSFAHCHCWAPTPRGCCSRGLGCQWAQSSETQLQNLSRPAGPREVCKPGEQSNKDAIMKVHEAKEMAPEMRPHDGHGSQIQWTQPGLLFAMITKHDFGSWTVKAVIKGKSYTEGINNAHLQSFIEWTPIKRMRV